MKKISTLLLLAALSTGSFSLQAAYSGVGTFNKIASASEITTGSYVFMANDQAMSNDFNKRFTAVALTYADGTKTSITDPDASIVFDIVADNGTLTITNGDQEPITLQVLEAYEDYTATLTVAGSVTIDIVAD